MATGTEKDEVVQLFEGYKVEHPTSSLTLPQFQQVRINANCRIVSVQHL